MSTNLVSLVLQFLTPDVIAKIASTLGVDRNLIGKAVTAAIPALIGTLGGAASRPGGAQKLATEVSRQSPGILDTLSSAITGPGKTDLVNSGIGSLTSLLGTSSVPALAGALGKFAGLNQATSSSLIGMLAPAVLGLLGRQKSAQGLDDSGLARLLTAQKDNVAAAMPAGFGNMLKDAGLPGFTGHTTATTKPRLSKPAPNIAWWSWLLPLVAIAAAAWFLFGDRGTDVLETTEKTSEQAVRDLAVDGVDLRSKFRDTIGNLTNTLKGISDGPTAQAAMTDLNSASSELDTVAKLSEKLPAEGKSALASLVVAARPTIDELFDKILAIPGVSDIAGPTIAALRTKLDALGKS